MENDSEPPNDGVGIIVVGGKGNSSNGGDSANTGITSKDYSYLRTDICYLINYLYMEDCLYTGYLLKPLHNECMF